MLNLFKFLLLGIPNSLRQHNRNNVDFDNRSGLTLDPQTNWSFLCQNSALQTNKKWQDWA